MRYHLEDLLFPPLWTLLSCCLARSFSQKLGYRSPLWRQARLPDRLTAFCALKDARRLDRTPYSDTAEIRFPAVRSPRFWVSGYCTKWRIQGQFSWLVFLILQRQNLAKKLNTQPPHFHIRSLNAFVATLYCAPRKWSLHSRWNFYLGFHWVTRPPRWTLTNGTDVKYVFPRCRSVSVFVLCWCSRLFTLPSVSHAWAALCWSHQQVSQCCYAASEGVAVPYKYFVVLFSFK